MQVQAACGEEEIHALGLSCSAEQPCPVFLELSDIEPVGSKLFISGNLHTSSSTLSSVMLATEDGGKTWFEPHDRVRSGVLDQIQFFDFETGWVAGQVVRALPRDPFFLLTTDGGKTWRRKPVYDEARVASIEHFRFESRANGILILDRSRAGEAGVVHELLETMTGGESWSLREVSSKPIKPKQAAKPPTGWRLNPHGPTKSYRVERRQNERWTPMASFLIEAGECRIADQALPEPPPETLAPASPPEPELPRVPAQKKKPSLERRKP
jgi:photosystem II stability/assembly factor-like uncharacterized protein